MTDIVTKMKQQDQENQEMINNLLGLGEEELYWLTFEVAEIFLLDQTNRDLWATKELLNNREPFWPWFINEWAIVNKMFIFSFNLRIKQDKVNKGELFPTYEWKQEGKKQYKEHQLKVLLQPHINGSYNNMISKYIKTKFKKQHV